MPKMPSPRNDAGHHETLVDRGRRIACVVCALLLSGSASALDVNVVGLFPNKALVQIDGGALQTLSVGQRSREGAVLVSADRDGATFDVDGQRMAIGLGHARMNTSTTAPSAIISTDERGHFVTTGLINGALVRFAVDTGATYISLPAAEARRLGIDYRKGRKAVMETANGLVPAYRVQLDTVRVGDITVHGVDAVVTEADSPYIALLGMSFLNATDIRREGAIMTLTKRY
jgi:aspartyl protease family protein